MNCGTRVKIGGIGNVLMGDDGVGPYIARMIDALYEFDADVEVQDLGTPGLDLIVHVEGLDALVLIDAVDNQQPAGTVTFYTQADILRHAPSVRMDPHSPALKETLLLADLEGEAPKDVVLVGISGEQYEMGNGLSDSVRQSSAAAIEIVLRELTRAGVHYKKRENVPAFEAWWEAPVEVEICI